MAARKIEFYNLREDPDLLEQLIENRIQASDASPVAKGIIRSMYREQDRAHAFQRYYEGLDFNRINLSAEGVCISRTHPLWEIGGATDSFPGAWRKAGLSGWNCWSWSLILGGWRARPSFIHNFES